MDDLTRAAWRKSTYSGSGNACVEIRFSGDDTDVRDSKNPAGPTLSFPTPAWHTFLSPTPPA